jgi:hypothetical protein
MLPTPNHVQDWALPRDMLCAAASSFQILKLALTPAMRTGSKFTATYYYPLSKLKLIQAWAVAHPSENTYSI